MSAFSGEIVVPVKNPVQLFHCPGCGMELRPIHYKFIRKAGEQALSIACPNRDCAFASGLPVYVVDDDIYRERPTLLLCTVDKFAALHGRSVRPRSFQAMRGSRRPS